jgi:hypothetical protein
MRHQTYAGVAGLILLLPAAMLVTTGLLELDRPAFVVHPVLVMGGLAVALVWNAATLLRVAVHREPDAVVGVVRVKVRGLGLVVLGLGAALLMVIAAYLLVENFHPRIV